MEIVETVEIKKVKKPRSEKQIQATKLLVERNRLRREAKKKESEKLPDLPADKPLVIQEKKEVLPEIVPEVKVKKVRKPRAKKVKPPTPPPPSSDSESEYSLDEEVSESSNKIDIKDDSDPYIEYDEPLAPIEPPKPRVVKLPRRYR